MASAPSPDTPVIAAVSPAFHRPGQPRPRQRDQQQQQEQQEQQQQEHHKQNSQRKQQQTLPPLSWQPSSPYTRAMDNASVSSPSPSAGLDAASRPTLQPPRVAIGKENSTQAPSTVGQPQVVQSPQTLKTLSSPQRSMPLQPQQSSHSSNASNLTSKSNASASPRQPARSETIPTSGKGHGQGPGPGHGVQAPGYAQGSSPGVASRRTSSPMVSPSSPRSSLPPSGPSAGPSTSLTLSSTANAATPRPRPMPPTLPPARAHGIHARSLTRPLTTTAQPNLPAPSAMTSSPASEKGRTAQSTAANGRQTVITHSPGPRESIYPAPALQAPQQAHQPRQRQSASSARSPMDSTVHSRPAPPPTRHSSGISIPTVQSPMASRSEPAVAENTPESKLGANMKQETGSCHSNSDPNPLEEEDSEGDDEDEEDDIKRPEGEKTKRSRQRKVRKSLEKLTRLSIDKRRRSRQFKALTAISPASSSTSSSSSTATAALKAEALALTPKRQSLWASLFGNGKAEARPTLSDSLVRSNGSTQSLGSLTSQSKDLQMKTGNASPLSPPVSSRPEEGLSDLSAHSAQSTGQETPPEQFSPGESVGESSISSSPGQEDALAVNVVRHERSRTIPGMLPQWDGSILWSLTRALSAKKPAAPPLESDSSDSDASAETATEGDDVQEEASRNVEGAIIEESSSGSSPSSNIGTGVQEMLSTSPSLPAQAALSIRTSMPRERVIVAEAQVQIGDDLDDENPFTDSHALPANSPAIDSTNATKGHLSATASASPGSSPSPSLSPLSYLTGSSASGSTWSLQGSRQSLMKMIFKSKNEPTAAGAMEASSSGSELYVEHTHRKAGSSVGSASPSTSLHSPQVDLFSDFESMAALDSSVEVQTKGIKRRSFIIPGAFPGEERVSEDHQTSLELEYEPAHVPMYAASEGDSLAVAQLDEPHYQGRDGDEHSDTRDDQQDYDSESSDFQEDMISTQPFKNSYERPSFLQDPHLPRFNTGASASPQRHQLHNPKQLISPTIATAKDKELELELDQEPLKIEVHSAAVVGSKTLAHRSSQSKLQSPPKAKKDDTNSIKLEKSSPSVLAVAQAPPATLTSALPARKSVVAPVTPPLRVAAVSSFVVDKRQALPSMQMPSTKDGGAQVLDNTIDYCRYKEEVKDSSLKNARPNWSHVQQSELSHLEATTGSGFLDSGSSDQTSEDSPLIVEVISSGLRSAGVGGQRSASPTFPSAIAAKQGCDLHGHATSTHAPQLHQPQGRANPPPLPPPRNARRPRSKTLSRHASMEITRISIDRLSGIAMNGESPLGRRDGSARNSATLSGDYGRPGSGALDSPAKEYIMEEMGSSQARTFNDEDYMYCQNQQGQHSSTASQETRDDRAQVRGQPYGEGNSAFDPYPEFGEQQQGHPTAELQFQQHHQLQLQQHQQEQTQSVLWPPSQQQMGSALSVANDALLVATLREQIASLSTERDQFYNETMFLRQKHDMLTNIVTNMGVAVESIQQQQAIQQQQQQQTYQPFAPTNDVVTLATMSNLAIPATDGPESSLYNNYGPAGGHNDYGAQSHQLPDIQPRRHHDEQALQYVDQPGQASLNNPFDFIQPPPQQVERDLYPMQFQQEEPQLQPRRNHFHDADQQRQQHTERVRQLSDEYLIQMPRNSEESLRGFHQHQQDPMVDMTQNQDFVYQSALATNDSLVQQAPYGRDGYQSTFDEQLMHDRLQHQQGQLQGQPLSFGEGYELIPTSDVGANDGGMTMHIEDAPPGEYYQHQQQQQQQQQLEDEQQRAGLTLQQLKQQHQHNQIQSQLYRRSTDTRHSSQGSQDGYQLLDIITTRPMSSGIINTGQSHAMTPAAGSDFGYASEQQQQQQQQQQAHGDAHNPEQGWGSLNPFSSNYNPARSAAARDHAQHIGHLQQSDQQQHSVGSSHLRRHHSMHHPQSSARQLSPPDMIQPQQQLHLQQQQYYQQQQQQQQQEQQQQQQQAHTNNQRVHQPRPPVWAPQHLTHSSSSSNMHRRQPSNPQQDAPNPPFEKGLLLLSSSTSFMNASDSPMLSSSTLHGSSGGSSAPLSLLSNVVQQEKVRIGEKTSSKHGAAGWSERPFSPVISNANEAQNSSINNMTSLTATMMASTSASSATTSIATKPRNLSKEDTDRIRQQFDSYLADPKRRSRHLDSEKESKEHERYREPPTDATSNSDLDSDTDYDEDKGNTAVGGVFPDFGMDALTVSGGSSFLNRSKTIASTGISSRGERRRSGHRNSGHFSNSTTSSSTATTTAGQQGLLQPVKDTLLRHHSSSGSLRSVARHSEQRRSEILRFEQEELHDAREETLSVQVLQLREDGQGEGTSQGVSPLPEMGNGGTTPSTLLSLPHQYPPPPAHSNHSQIQPQQQQQQPARKALPLPSTTLPRPTYKVPVESPGVLSASASASGSGPVSSSLGLGILTSSSSKTVVDEEGGDWGLQAQPRRYNSVKLGMTGVTGVTRRAIGRPIERGHGIERGPEDCV